MAIEPSLTAVLLNGFIKGGIINSPAMALKYADLILQDITDKVGYEQQLPLKVEDQGEAWCVEGSYNADLKKPGTGPWQLLINKLDGKILYICYKSNLLDAWIEKPRDRSNE